LILIEGGHVNIIVTEGAQTLIDFEIADGSHVYVSDGASEYYREWDDLTEQERKNYQKLAGLWCETLRTELGKLAK
jgi:hypothetical protein